MDKDFNNNGFIPPYMDYGMFPPGSMDMNEMMMQYEQGCSYYRYLCMQMDYKIKCKEYEKICANTYDKTNRKIE